MGERFSGYMRDRISDPLIKKQPQITEETDKEIRNHVKAVAAARPPEGNRWSDAEDSDDLVTARIAADLGKALPLTDDVTKAQDQAKIQAVRKNLHTVPQEVLPENVTRIHLHSEPLSSPIKAVAGGEE